MNIIEYIPYGKENAISRVDLVSLTGCPDRVVRDMIHDARRERPILSRTDGGYYLPTANETREVEQFYKRESNRAKSTFWALKSCRDWLNEQRKEREPETFLIEATKCKRCGGILTSSEAVQNGFGHTCLQKEKLDEQDRSAQVSFFDTVATC